MKTNASVAAKFSSVHLHFFLYNVAILEETINLNNFIIHRKQIFAV